MKDEVSGMKWQYRAAVISALLSVVAYLVFALWGGWQSVVHAIKEVGAGGVAIMLLLSFINYIFRFQRWTIYLERLGHTIPSVPNFIIYLSGFAFTATPGKAGEAMRGIALKKWGVPYTHGFAAFVSERISDLLAVILLAAIGVTVYPGANAVFYLSITITVLLYILVSKSTVHAFIIRVNPFGGFLKKAIEGLAGILRDANRLNTLGVFLISVCLGVLGWGAEGVAFYFMLQWMGMDTTLLFALFVYSLSMLAGALSFLPGGLGGAEAVMLGLLLWHGMPNPDAVAATVLIRIVTLWFAVIIGTGCLVKLRAVER
jgi:uncharacterized protein (TIRG00374 family)